MTAALIFVATLPVAAAGGIFIAATWRLAILRGHSATALQWILGGLTFLALFCVPTILAFRFPSTAPMALAAAGFGAWLPLGVIAWATVFWRTGTHRRTGPPRRRHHYRRLAVVVVIVAVTACGLIWSALGPLWALPFLAPAVYPVLTLLAYERRFRAQAVEVPSGFALYLRWFGTDQHTNVYPTSADAARLGWVDSSGWVSLERLLSVEFLRRLGGFVALGSPHDVVPPGGATRLYFDDDAWQENLKALAVRAAVVVMEPGDTRWIEWELGMIRELGLEQRFFVVTPPGGELRRHQLYQRIGRTVLSIIARLSRSTPPTWPGFSTRLRNAGFEPPPGDPGPGCVLAAADSRLTVLRSGLTSSDEFVGTILAQLPPHHASPS